MIEGCAQTLWRLPPTVDGCAVRVLTESFDGARTLSVAPEGERALVSDAVTMTPLS